ncbi:tetratricopeptide repeat protein [Phormidium tenue]|uniref:Tetratricopeptide repeat protein n=1 Tax=Phormidium tenue FACHB-1050 TaxID=2692857 RepID=A0ABR8CE81_9CYAN|nr:tetratricopeptide repeat protein [Phormidium tenue]MBD2318911.1 tetratricopeptide repeat protein [Phormidium tenue FACHB-1050]
MDLEQLNSIIARILEGSHTEKDMAVLSRLLENNDHEIKTQFAKFNVNITDGKDIYIGDHIYLSWNKDAVNALIEAIQKNLAQPIGVPENLPRSGVVEFVGRNKVMTQLHKMLQHDNRVAISAITGMGGIGKTELALQYALKYHETYQSGICWITARGVDVGTQIVQFTKLFLNLLPPENFELMEQVKFCWRQWKSGEVLLIFDDVTNYSDIQPYLPPSTANRFKVIITTRLRMGVSVNQLELDVLTQEAAIELLESLVGSDRIQASLEAAKQLCAHLGCLPLGLELVGRYLNRKSDLSLKLMQKRLKDKRLSVKALCQPDADMTAPLSVATAFELSWDTLSESAKSIGYLLSLFAETQVSWSLIELCWIDKDLEEIEETRDSELLNLHLLQRTNFESYRLHPLIRSFIQTKLEQSLHVHTLKEHFCKTMVEIAQKNTNTPTDKPYLVPIDLVIPHLEEVVNNLFTYLNDKERIIAYSSLGWFYKFKGLYIQSEKWYSQCLLTSQIYFGMDSLDVATNLNRLASIYSLQGRYKDAEELHKRSLKLRQYWWGDEHQTVAESLSDLAELYRDQGRYDESEPLQKTALTIFEKQLGSDHSDVAKSLNNLGLLYKKQGRYIEAEALYQSSLTILEKHLGSEHPDLAIYLDNLAVLYVAQELYSKAEPIYQRALTIFEKQLGSEHPDLAICLDNFAHCCRLQKRYDEAEILHKRALTVFEKQLGSDHPEFASCLKNIANLYRDQKRYSEAELNFHKALDIFKKTLGEEHPRVGQCLDNLAIMYEMKGYNQIAQKFYAEALNILEKGLGSKHSWTIKCKERLEKLHIIP